MARGRAPLSTWLLVVLALLVILLAASGEGAGSIVATLVAGIVVVWLAFGVIFKRRRR
jgi:hypothetical protein